MIAGTVTPSREAFIRFVVRGPAGEQDIEAVVDTGFNRFLTLPPPTVSALDLAPRGTSTATLADGREQSFDVYEVVVLWDGRPRRISIEEADTIPLVGMGLLHGYKLQMEVRSGGRVLIEALTA